MGRADGGGALTAELVAGRLDAVLDVTDPEPLPEDSPLFDLPNVLLTPHIAGALGNEVARLGDAAGTDADRDSEDATAIRRLRAISDGLAGLPVTVALETPDSHPRGADAARIAARCPGVTVIWDTLHTWRAGEKPAETWAAPAERLAYVQVKDVASPDDLAPLPPGDGVLPLATVATALRAGGYRGWISWEYERRWFPDRPPLAKLAGRVADTLRGYFSRPASRPASRPETRPGDGPPG